MERTGVPCRSEPHLREPGASSCTLVTTMTLPGRDVVGVPACHSTCSHFPKLKFQTRFLGPWKIKAAVVPLDTFHSFKMWLLPLSPLIQENPPFFLHLKAMKSRTHVTPPEQALFLRVKKNKRNTQKQTLIHSLPFITVRYKNGTVGG